MTFESLGIRQGHCYVVAEVAQAHDGSLGTAHAYIDAAAEAGADAIKFQTHIADAESTLDEPWRVKFSRQDNSRFDYWRRMEFTPEQWAGLATHCRERGIEFMSSPFSVEAVAMLKSLGMRLWKVASGEIYNPPLIEAVLATGAPVVYSSGMSRLEELDELVASTRRAGNDFALLQCATAYPCPPELWGLGVMEEFRRRFHCIAGFSDHSGDIHAGLAAAALGASILELHITFDHAAFGPDTPASITTRDLPRLVAGVRAISKAQSAGNDKAAIAAQTGELRDIFGRSLALKQDLPAGHVLSAADLALKKPAGGIPWERRDEVIGRTLERDASSRRLLREEDLC
jgi:N-acetylneuraminate synthase